MAAPDEQTLLRSFVYEELEYDPEPRLAFEDAQHLDAAVLAASSAARPSSTNEGTAGAPHVPERQLMPGSLVHLRGSPEPVWVIVGPAAWCEHDDDPDGIDDDIPRVLRWPAVLLDKYRCSARAPSAFDPEGEPPELGTMLDADALEIVPKVSRTKRALQCGLGSEEAMAVHHAKILRVMEERRQAWDAQEKAEDEGRSRAAPLAASDPSSAAAAPAVAGAASSSSEPLQDTVATALPQQVSSLPEHRSSRFDIP